MNRQRLAGKTGKPNAGKLARSVWSGGKVAKPDLSFRLAGDNYFNKIVLLRVPSKGIQTKINHLSLLWSGKGEKTTLSKGKLIGNSFIHFSTPSKGLELRGTTNSKALDEKF